jgi:putative ABC transport system ATP-binding protein
MIKVVNVDKVFQNKGVSNHVINQLNFHVFKNEFVGIMGSSGSGKTTLLHMLSSMGKATSGDIMFNGQSLSELNNEQLSKIRLESMGFVFQQPYLLKDLSIYDNICLPGYLSKKNSKELVQQRAIELLKKLDIYDIKDRLIDEASGGQLQRVSIARALINDPEVVFCDEPTGALNSKATDDVMKILKQIKEEGKTIVLVTHDPKVASYCDRVAYMKDGCIVDQLNLQQSYEQSDTNKNVMSWLANLGF